MLVDFNFVEVLADSSTESDYYHIPNSFAEEWSKLLAHFDFQKVSQHSFTCYSTKDKDNIKGARLDRIYISHTEADLCLYSAATVIPHIPHSILTTFKQSQLELIKAALRAKTDKENQPIRRLATSDHVPVALRFQSTMKDNASEFRG